MKVKSRHFLVFAFIFNFSGAIDALQREILVRQSAEVFADSTHCYYLLGAVTFLTFSYLFSGESRLVLVKLLSISASIGAVIFNLLFLIDGVEKRRAVAFMVGQEILTSYYRYWERVRWSEYAICSATLLIMFSVFTVLLNFRKNSASQTASDA